MNITELDKFKLEDAVKFHDKLNPRLFDGKKLRPVIKHQLQEIAKDFIEFMGIPTLAIEDVIITGSNVAYTYTPHSDIDLHLLVDFSKLPNNEVYQELFKAKKTLYNNTYDITVRDIPVELYVQDTAQPHVSLGEYSLVQDKLTRIPTKKRANFDQTSAAAKFERLEELCIEALKADSLPKVEKVLDIIKRYRQAGLDRHGEFGPENLAFKAIRSKGYFQRLHDHRNYLKSELLSIEETNKRKQFEESIGIEKVLNKPTPSVEELAQRYNVSRQKVLQQLDKGIKIEKEHTSDREVAKQIALDHLGEKLEYYELLSKFDEMVKLSEAPRTLQSQVTPLGKLVQAYSYLTTFGMVHLNKDGATPEAQQQLLALVQRMNKDGKTFANLDKQKIEANRDTILSHIHSMMQYAIPVLKKNLPADKWEAKRGQINAVLTAYNNARQTNEASGYITSAKENVNFVKPQFDESLMRYGPKQFDQYDMPDYSQYLKLIDQLAAKGYKRVDIIRFLVSKFDEVENQDARQLMYIHQLLNRNGSQPDPWISEGASGYIPSEAEKNDPRFKMALTVDIKPDTMQKNAKKLGWKIQRDGRPPLLRK